MMKPIKIYLLVLLFFFGLGAQAMSLSAIKKSNEAKELLESAVTMEKNEETQKMERNIDSTKVLQAYKLLLDALKDDPFNPIIHTNLGFAFEYNDEKLKALNEFKLAQKLAYRTNNNDLKYYTDFNLARAYGDQKSFNLALKHYQAALDAGVDDEKVKINIELLMQQQMGQDQNQGGQGKGGDKDKKKDPKGGGDQKDQKKKDKGKGDKDKEQPKKKKQKRKFKSKELTKNDVKRILEELKNQEQKIREKEFGGKAKERPLDKEW